MTKDMDIDLQIEADEVAYIYLGTDKHNNLKNLDLPDSHPIRAITGLQEVVDKVGRTEDGAEVNRIIGVRVNGTPLDIAEDRTVDVPVPTSYGYYLDLDGNNGVISLKDRDGVVLSTIDTNLERIVKSGRYDASTNELVLVLDDNSEIRIDASKLVDVYTADGETIVENGHVFALSNGSKDALKNSADHIADRSNPHNVTKDQVGLGNVDNTSDAKKPISEATQSALNDCVKLSGSDSAQVIANGGLQIPNGDLSVGGGALIGKDTEPALLRVRGSIEATQSISGQLVQTENVASNDSSTKVASTAWVNSADSVLHTTGGTMTGMLKLKKDSVIYNNADASSFPSAYENRGSIYFRDTKEVNRGVIRCDADAGYFRAYLSAEGIVNGESKIARLDARVFPDGTICAYAPTWKTGVANNTDTILTTKMANSFPSLVHTTGNEDISGTKRFSDPRIYTTLPLNPTSFGTGRLYVVNKDTNDTVGYLGVAGDSASTRTYISCFRDVDGKTVQSSVVTYVMSDGDCYATAPPTKDTHPNDAIVTKKYLLDKIAALEARIATLEAKP